MDQIKLDQFLNYKFISGLSSNPSKTHMAFLVARADMKKNDYLYDLYVSDGLKHKKLTSLKNKGSFLWESDHTLLFPLAKNKAGEKKQKDKYVEYYRYNLDTKVLEKAYVFPFLASIVKVLNDQKLLLTANLTREQHHLYLDSLEDRKVFLEQEKKTSLYEDINEIPFYFNGSGFIANLRKQLFIYDIAHQSVSNLVDTDFNVGQVIVSDDLNSIYYTGKQMTGVKQLTTDIYRYDIHLNQTETLYHEDEYAISNIHLIQNQLIAIATDMKNYGLNQNDDFFILKNKKLELLKKYGQSVENSLGTDCKLGVSPKNIVIGNQLYFVATIDDHTELHSINLHGVSQPEYIFNGSIDGVTLVDDKVYIIGLYKQKLQEIYHLDLLHHEQKCVTSFNQKSLKNLYVAKPKEIIVDLRTHQVKGWVLYPKDFNPNHSYPAILDIHGGPKTIYGKVFFHEMQYWANEGYIVYFANPRGSDGKGDEFSDIRGKYGTIDYHDLMAFTDKVLKKVPSIDKQRMFVTGGSYGGFMTNWIVGQTNRFKAAATQRSISNWLSFHGTSDIGFYFSQDQTAGHPIEDTVKLWNQSPMKYAHNIKTPLLFIHSDMDYRCPVEQAMQLYTVVKQNGIMSKLVWFKGETHELSRSGKPEARIKRLDEITKWFKQF
ncbi:MAG: S9 family peptidase [Acholeplasmataceae bacterium]|nr:S9 family peptidase [Acholeplasmataceae bacterium]